MLRGRLGLTRINRHLVGDANPRAIRRLDGEFRIEDFTIGGAAPKVFIVFETPIPLQEAYIAKAPSKGNSTACECITEHLISCIGRMLPLKVAESRLAILPGGPVPDVRFMSRYFLKTGEALRHGIELVASCFNLPRAQMAQEIPPGAPEERRFYTVDLIAEVLSQVARNPLERDRGDEMSLIVSLKDVISSGVGPPFSSRCSPAERSSPISLSSAERSAKDPGGYAVAGRRRVRVRVLG